jgi:hypothetical protein
MTYLVGFINQPNTMKNKFWRTNVFRPVKAITNIPTSTDLSRKADRISDRFPGYMPNEQARFMSF